MLDPKFKYNGKTFSLEAINAKAASKGLSTEDYLKQNPEIIKIEDPDFPTPTTPGAVVEGPAAPDTDFNLGDPSLESSDPELSAREIKLDEIVLTGKKPTLNQIKAKNNLEQFQNTVSDLLKNYDPNTEEGYYDFFGEEVEGATLVDKYNSNPKAFEKYLKRFALSTTFGDEDQRNLFEKITFAYKYRGFVNKKNVDDVVKEQINKLLADEGKKEIQENIENVIGYKKAGLYGESIKFTFNNFFKHLPDHEKKIFNIKNQIDELQLELDNFEASGLTDEGKKKELIIKRNNLNQELNNIIGDLGGRDAYQFKNRKPLFNLYGDPISEFEAINFKKENVKTFEVEYDEKVKTFKNQDREALQNGFFNLGLDILDLENEMNQKYTIKFDSNFLQESSTAAESIVSRGFKIKTKDGKIISNSWEIEDEYIKEGEVVEQLSYNDLVKIFGISDSGKIIGNWDKLTIMDVNGQNISGEDFRDDLYNEKIDLGLQKAAYRETFILNLDPASKTTDSLDVAETFIKEAVTGIGKLFYDKAGDRMPLTRQEELDAIYSVFQDIGYEMTDEQKEAFDKSFAMEFAEGLGGFVPDLIQFALLNKVAGATGITTRINSLMKSNKFYGVLSNMMLEGVKFQIVMGEPTSEMFTEGAAFGGFSMAATGVLGKLGIQLSGSLAPLNAIFQKGTAGGFGMASGSEGAQIVHAVIDDFLGNKALVTSMKELYGDFDEATGRILMNGALGSFIPIVQTHPAHFKTMAARTNLLRKLRLEILEGKYKGIEAKQKVALIAELQRDVNLYNKKFDALDIQSQKKAADNALSIVNSKKITVIENGKEVTRAATTSEIREAQKTINRYETNKADARKKIYEWDSALREAGVVSKDYKGVKIYDFKNKAEKEKAVTAGIFESVNNKAQYNRTTKEVAIDINSFKKGVWSQEIGHVFMSAAFNSNPKAARNLQAAIENKVNKDLEGVKFEVGDKKGLTFKEAINEAYKGKNNVPEEYVMNVLEFLANPKYKSLMLEKGIFQSVKESLLQHGNFLGLNFTNKKNFRTPEELLTFFENLGTQLESSNVKSIKKQYKDFSNIVIDGKKLINLKTGKDIKKEIKEEKAASKEIDARAETLILKQRQGVAKTPKGKRILEENIREQYNKLALKALGFNVQKSLDAKALGLTDIQLKEALSFVGEYYQGIKQRYNTEFKVGEIENVKFSTYVDANIRPKRQAFYEEALGKGREVTTRITEETKELADTSTTLTEGPKLIEPLETLAPNKFKEYQSQYEAGLKNIDLSKQDYSTLKDAAPKITKEIFGGKSFKQQQNFINKNLKTIYDLFPLAFRLQTKGTTKSSTGINTGILKNFYVTGKRADMKTGTAAGLPIRAKMPFDAIIPEGPNKGKKVSDLFKELVGIDVVPNRNQRTFVKGVQAEIGKAITNRVARQALEKQSNTADIVKKLADGKSDVLASKIIKENANLFEVIRKYDGNMDLIRKNNPKAAQELDAFAANAIKAFEGVDGAVNYVKDFFKNTLPEFKNLDISNIQSDNYKAINVEKATKFAKNSRELLEYLPEWMKENKTLAMGLLTLHYRTNMEGISFEKLSEKFDVKTKKGFSEMPEFTKTWDPKSLGKKGQEIWEGISQKELKSISVLKNAYDKAHKLYEQNKTKEGDQIIKDAYTKLGNSVKKKIIDAWGNSLEAWLNSSKTPKQRLERVEHIVLMGRQNTNVQNGLRQLVPIEAIFTGKLKPGEITKLEHTSPMVKFALEFSRSIVEGNWQKNKNSIINNYTGIVGPKKVFDIIDAIGKKTNPAGMARMLFDPATLKMFKTVDSGFKQSLYDVFNKASKNTIEGVQTKRAIFRQAQDFILSEFKKHDAQINKQKIDIVASKDISGEFNQYLEKSTGIGAEKVFSRAKADARAAQVKKSFGDYILPPGAEDFGGLMHKTLAKGKQGEKQLEFYKRTLYDPYNLAIENITRERISLTNDFRALKNDLSGVPKNLKQFTKGGDYTKEQAVRVAVWNKLGYEIPGISKTDLKALVKEVNSNPELNLFANELIRITKGDGYAKPDNSWVAGNIAIDMMSLLNGVKRTKHLEVWQNNVNEMFSKENLMKLEAAYGKEWVKNVTRTLERMKTGSNRKWGGNETVQKWNDWVNGSVGTIMFLNSRSAVLQTISNINYLNFSDNNPLQAAKAFANQKQYWKDFIDIFNSGYLRDRRGYNKININESELALAAEKGGARGVIAMLLNKGFVLTKIADSFAIASGGATMYRNRLNRYKKEGMSEKEAAEKAFLDFKEITEKTQQSSRPDKISEQQAGGLGRFMLAFANTPMQYNRMIKRDIQDLLAGRGNRNEQLTRITYYSTIQNFIFNAMSKALFGLAFNSDEENEKSISKFSQTGEGMADSLLRGTGLQGNAVVAVKNLVKAYVKGEREPVLKAFTISPPLYGKVTRLRGAYFSSKAITKNNMFEPSLSNPSLSATAQLSSAAFNLPLDRALRKAQNIEAAMSDDAEYWQKVALMLGWSSWELGIEKNKKSGDVFSRSRKGFENERTSLFDRKRTSIFK